MDITFITGNAAKAEQLAHHLDMPLAHQKIDLPEIQSLSLEEVVERKAMEAYQHLKSPVLVEDTSLVFQALGKLPGPLIKWFLTELDNQGLCQLLNSYSDRSAAARVVFGLYDGRDLQMFDGTTLGYIADQPRGQRGFGWDPIFIPEGYAKTWGEMTLREQEATSMRRKALKKLETHLKTSA